MAQRPDEDTTQQAETKDSTAVRVDKEGLSLMTDILRLLQTRGLDAFPALVQPDLTPTTWGESPSRARVVRAALRLLKQDISLRVGRNEGPDRPAAIAPAPREPPIEAVSHLDVLSPQTRQLLREVRDEALLDTSGPPSVFDPRQTHGDLANGWVCVSVVVRSGLDEKWEEMLLEAILDQSSSYSSGALLGEGSIAMIFIRTALLYRLAEDVFYIWKGSRVELTSFGPLPQHVLDEEGRVIDSDQLESMVEELSNAKKHPDYEKTISAISAFYGGSKGETVDSVVLLERIMRRELVRKMKVSAVRNEPGPRMTHPVTVAAREERQRRAIGRKLVDLPRSPSSSDKVFPVAPQIPFDRIPGNPSGLLVAAYGAPGIGLTVSTVDKPDLE